MRKINASFSLKRIKRIMNAAYRAGSNEAAEISKLIIKNKLFTPARIDRLEVVIQKRAGSNEIISIPRESLTFLQPYEPYELVDSLSAIEGSYIILPWNISTELGREDLRRLLEQLPGGMSELNVSGIVFSVFEDTGSVIIDEGSVSNVELSMSKSMRLDDTEMLFERIRFLEGRLLNLEHDLDEAAINADKQGNLILEKDGLIGNLNIQINDRQKEIDGLEVKVKNLDARVINLQNTNTSLQNSNVSLQNQITQLRASQTVDITFSGGGNFGDIGGNTFVVNGTRVTLNRQISGVTFG